jgi:predicted component of type VI protein secretion system
MPAPLRNANVNWVNGMKIRKEHFVQQNNAMEDKLKDVAACFINTYNYGLLPIWLNEGTSCKVAFMAGTTKFLDINVFHLRALTRGGARIEILEDLPVKKFSLDISKETEAAKKEENGSYYIMLSIDLFNREPFGELATEEEPPRYPYIVPSYKVNLISEKDVAKTGMEPWSLFIGKISIKPDRLEISEDYIPACMSIKSHIKLIEFSLSAEKFYNQLESNLVSIIRKIREKGQDSSLAGSVLILSENLLNFTGSNILKVKWHLPDQPPLYLFENIAGFARLIRNTIDSNSAAQKEELLNYFTNWSELKQGDFERLLVYCINFEYNHHEIINSVYEFTEFIQIIDTLFAKLESLAYIGKKKETNIFVKEQSSKRSFLID